MSIVGEFPGLNSFRRRTIRGPVNPMDKATIVSIYPKELDEMKVTIFPGRFIVPPGNYENPSVTIVGPSSWWREIDEEQPLLEIPVSAIQIADSVVRDYCNGLYACNMSTAMPGLFYVPGCKFNDPDAKTGVIEPSVSQTIKWIKTDYRKALDAAKAKQTTFYTELVKSADSLWARSNGNPLAISDDMRMAARELGVQTTKDWMKDFQMVEMVRCKACGSLKNPQFPICATCHFPDPDHPMTKQLLALRQQMPSSA